MGALIRKNTDLTGVNEALSRIRGKHESSLWEDDEFEGALDSLHRMEAETWRAHKDARARDAARKELEARAKREKGVTPGKG